MGEKHWYLAKDGKMEGPFTHSEVLAKLRSGEADERFFVFAQGDKQWQPLLDSAAFVHALDNISPPPPPPPTLWPDISARSPKTPSLPSQEQTHPGYETKPPRRWGWGLILALVLGAAGFYGGAALVRSPIAAAIGVVLGAMLGFMLAGRKTTVKRKSVAKSTVKRRSRSSILPIGTILSIAGLVGTYIAYEPLQFEAIAVYPDGRRDQTHMRFRDIQDCMLETERRVNLFAETMARNPTTKYEGMHSFKCERICPDKFECTLRSLESSF